MHSDEANLPFHALKSSLPLIQCTSFPSAFDARNALGSLFFERGCCESLSPAGIFITPSTIICMYATKIGLLGSRGSELRNYVCFRQLKTVVDKVMDARQIHAQPQKPLLSLRSWKTYDAATSSCLVIESARVFLVNSNH